VHAVLIDGRETRHLRVPKQILPFGDTTVTGRTYRTYVEAGFAEILLVLGYKADIVIEELGPLPGNVRVVRNPLHDEGIASYIRAGMREVPSSAAGFCIGFQDQPLLTKELLTEFCDVFAKREKPILLPVYWGSPGLPAFFDRSLHGDVAQLGPRETLWDLVKRHGDQIFDHPTGYTAVVRSIDDMDDYHEMLRMAGLPIPEILPNPGGSAAEGSASQDGEVISS
jgi:molybdenum cofactor cytidylyltransferase